MRRETEYIGHGTGYAGMGTWGVRRGVREIGRSLEQWEVGVNDLLRRMILASTPRARERWYPMLLLAQCLTAEALE